MHYSPTSESSSKERKSALLFLNIFQPPFSMLKPRNSHTPFRVNRSNQFLPGRLCEQSILGVCSPWGLQELDMTEHSTQVNKLKVQKHSINAS